MEHVTPRWEWRAFGDDLGAAQSRLEALTIDKVQRSDEIYLVSAVSDANVKIRDDLLDMKRLEQVDSHGLEQWLPVLKVPFPLAASALAQVRAALGLPAVQPGGDTMSLDRMLGELAPAGAPVRAVKVTKTRNRCRIHGCVGELTDLIADGNKGRTVAIEDADPDKVIAAVHAMGLDGFRNTSYPRGLRQVIGLAMRGTP